MFKRFTSYLYYEVVDEEIMLIVGLYALFMGIISVLLLVHQADPVFSHGSYIILLPLVIFSVVGYMFLGVLRVLDMLIEHSAKEITGGDISIKDYFLRHLLEESEFGYGRLLGVNNIFQLSGIFGMIFGIIYLVVALIYFFPWLSVFPLMGLGYIIVIKILRSAYRVNKKLKAHVADPDAHKRSR